MKRGFVIAPILYMLGLIGVSAGVLFSGYSQIIKSNILLTNANNDRNSLQTAANYMSGAAVLGTDGITVCPPRSGSASAVCSSAPQYLTDLSTLSSSDPHLPTGWQNAASTGSPHEVGILSGGLSQLDSEGHYWIVCRWENPTSEATQPAIKIIGVGASGVLNTKCGDTQGSGGNYLKQLYVADLMQRASAWNLTGNTATFGATGSKVTIDASGDITTTGNITGGAGVFSSLADSGTATISGTAIMNGGASVVGGLASDTITNIGKVTIGGFVGIGTAAPEQALNIYNGNIEIDSDFGAINLKKSNGVGIAQIQVSGTGDYVQMKGSGLVPLNDDSMALGVNPSTQRWHSLFIGTGNATFAGNVGIGTTVPNAELSVVQSSGVSLFTGNIALAEMIQTSSAGKYTGIDFGDLGRSPNPLARIAMYTSNLGSYLQFGTSANWGNGVNSPAMTIDYSGNVGIGTTSPTYTLQVNGTFSASGVASLTGGAAVTGGLTTGTLTTIGMESVGGTLSVSGTTTLGAALNGTTAVFSGSVKASQFIGTMALGTSGVTLSGILPIANGGTGASTASAALLNLGVTNASGYLVPPLPFTGVSSGVCAVPTVGTDGRVTACGTSGSFSSLTDSGAATISGNLSVGGTTSLAGLTAATGSFSGNLAASSFSLVGDESMYGSLGVGCAANDNLSLTVCHSSENGPIAFFTQSTNTDGVVGINAPTGYGAYLAFDDNETDYWSIGKAEAQYGRGFYVWDYTNQVNLIYGEHPSGDLMLGESTSLYLTITATGKAGFGVYPINFFDVAGGVALGTAYAGQSTAPTNGLIVQGNVGIGTASPAVTLDVAGYMRLKKESAAPATCSSTIDGAIALTAVYTLCVCKSGTGWVTASTGSTTCTW